MQPQPQEKKPAWYAEWKRNKERIPVGFRFCDDCHSRTGIERVGNRITGENMERVVCRKCNTIILEAD